MRKYAQVSNETYLYDKRSLSSMRKCQKRPIHMTKEAFLYDERSLLRLAYLRFAQATRGEWQTFRAVRCHLSLHLAAQRPLLVYWERKYAAICVPGTHVCGHVCIRNTRTRMRTCVYQEHMYVCIRNTRTCMRPCVYQEHMYAHMYASDTRIKYRLDGIYLCIWHASDASVSDA